MNTNTSRFELKKDQILFTAGEVETDLYVIKNGKVLVFVQNGSKIIPVAYLGADEFIGELSFFDGSIRSASIICVENTTFVKIPSNELHKHIPDWLKKIGLQLSRKIRSNDELIRTKGIRKTKVETIKPLSIEEQTKIFKIVAEYKNK